MAVTDASPISAANLKAYHERLTGGGHPRDRLRDAGRGLLLPRVR